MASPLLAGRYKLDSFIGGGNFGEVWRAEDTYLAQPVAVKLFPAGIQPDTVLLEAQLQRKLSEHPNIVTINNVVVEPPRPFVVSELYEDGNVADRIGADGSLLPDAMRWMRDLLAALAHAHGLGVIHRDVKPSNMLLTPTGGAALTDFGVAEDALLNVYVDRAIYSATIAPELLAGAGSSMQTDLWAAACTWYRLLCGRYPFAHQAAVVKHEYLPAHKVNPQIPLALSRAVDVGLAQDPANRYADADRMLTAVSALSYERGWERLTEPGAVEAWRLHGGDGDIIARLVQRPKLGPEILVTRDRGSGARRFIRKRPGSLAQSRQRLYTLLRHGVEHGL